MSNHPTKTDPPPPYGFAGSPPPQPQIVHQPVTMIVGTPPLGPDPSNVQCPSCHAQIQTRVQYETSTRTHLIALLLCVVGCWPCAIIPYCTEDCKTATHNCPSCGAYIGSYKK
ncbi:lipopolysaccharide-induced tumor necrosis factor-alpha factor homolog [Anabrus simplex]|uniref:lipopolysaccharide-induced tumor necrosis factor-alpha factor homolog n=1 Tax=Anabrus simplex TaxID=316456 RepID=UPI0035A32293